MNSIAGAFPPEAADTIFSLSVCICTRNRPDELERALQSVQRSSMRVHEIIVSDDSTDDRTATLVRVRHPEVVYVTGPRRGLCANRNHALQKVTGTHVLFIDDDVELGCTFVETLLSHITPLGRAERNQIIFTGSEVRNGYRVEPHEQSFLGFQRRPYLNGSPLNTIVINSTVFPASLFLEMSFDDRLVYGYDEVDLTTRAVAVGYRIMPVPEAFNNHYPSQINRAFYAPYTEASRLYVTLKRYLWTEKRPIKAATFILFASAHSFVHAVKTVGLRGMAQAWLSIKLAAAYTVSYARSAREPGHK